MLLVSCGASRKTTKIKTASEKSPTYVLNQLENQRLETDRFNAKAKVKYASEDSRVQFTVNVRMKKGEFIWMNASLLTYEVARILLRPDSLFAINRYEKTFVSASMDSIEKEFNIPLQFQQIQDLILGNHLLDDQSRPDFLFRAEGYEIRQKKNQYNIFHLIDPFDFFPTEIEVEDGDSGYTVEARLSEHKELEKSINFSYIREYIIKNHNTHFANIQVNFTDIDTKEPKKTPFRIPEHYERLD
jgi:hypothetical protein